MKKKIVVASVLLALTVGSVFAFSLKDAFTQGYNSGYSRYRDTNSWTFQEEQLEQAMNWSSLRNEDDRYAFRCRFNQGWVDKMNGKYSNPWAAWDDWT